MLITYLPLNRKIATLPTIAPLTILPLREVGLLLVFPGSIYQSVAKFDLLTTAWMMLFISLISQKNMTRMAGIEMFELCEVDNLAYRIAYIKKKNRWNSTKKCQQRGPYPKQDKVDPRKPKKNFPKQRQT